jgi:hypothetical protein
MNNKIRNNLYVEDDIKINGSLSVYQSMATKESIRVPSATLNNVVVNNSTISNITASTVSVSNNFYGGNINVTTISTKTLNSSGLTYVADDLTISTNLSVNNTLSVSTLNVNSTTVLNNLSVTSYSTVSGMLTTNGLIRQYTTTNPITGNVTIDSTDSGGAFRVNASCTITLIAPQQGLNYTFVINNASSTITFRTASGNYFYGNYISFNTPNYIVTQINNRNSIQFASSAIGTTITFNGLNTYYLVHARTSSATGTITLA